MEYQKIINLLENTPNQPNKFRTKNWVEKMMTRVERTTIIVKLMSSAIGETKFKLTDTKLYVPNETLSNQDNTKILQKLKSGFKRTINWNKYQTKVSREGVHQYLDFLIDSSFQGVNRISFYHLKMRMIEKYTQDIIFQKEK